MLLKKKMFPMNSSIWSWTSGSSEPVGEEALTGDATVPLYLHNNLVELLNNNRYFQVSKS